MSLQIPVLEWTINEVCCWLTANGFQEHTIGFHSNDIDGKALLLMTENDLKLIPIPKIGDAKRLTICIRRLQLENQNALITLGYDPATFLQISNSTLNPALINPNVYNKNEVLNDGFSFSEYEHGGVSSRYTPPLSEDGRSSKLRPEVPKALISLAYLFVVTWITAFVMVVVHDRVPDMKKYPPLPDIFLDNVPYIPWAFDMCEWTGSLLLFIWIMVLVFHKYRFILLRRFFALSGTVFLLRCVTMLITSLSVPGTHLQCAPRELDLSQYANHSKLRAKIYEAYLIWKGAGMSIQGVRTCGDYMFSGHTVALTMLNFFITEYTPRHFYFLHTFSWLLNMFGIFFILSGHEHYSIDVFVAFYITSRLFLYYHTLANNQALMQRDSNRTRIWFPLFSFFESSIDGIVPNEYESPLVHLKRLYLFLKNICNRYSFLHLTNRQLNSFSRHMCHDNNLNDNPEQSKEKES